jgi:hypothetical protein
VLGEVRPERLGHALEAGLDVAPDLGQPSPSVANGTSFQGAMPT